MLRFWGPTVYDGQVEWKDRSSDWIPLADLKNSYPVQLTKYAINNKIASAPAFACWVVPHVLKKRDQIIQKVQTHFRKKTHKFALKFPHQSEKLWTLTGEWGLICGARQSRKKCVM
jgi:hypothetical protein